LITDHLISSQTKRNI